MRRGGIHRWIALALVAVAALSPEPLTAVQAEKRSSTASIPSGPTDSETPDSAYSVVRSGCESEEPLRPTSPPTSRDDVFELKFRLFQLGLFYGSFDDRYDPDAQRAVLRLQKSRGLLPTGFVDGETWAAMVDPSTDLAPKKAEVALTAIPGERRILVDVRQLTLTLFVDGKPVKTYPIAIGRPGEETPVGEWRVVNRSAGRGGPFGSRWMGLNVPWGVYGIHGTNKPWSIGRRASAGCVRMHNRHVEELFSLVPIGTFVQVVGRAHRGPLRKVIRNGSTGPDVVQVQFALKEIGFAVGDADGRFGNVGVTAMQRLEFQYGLPINGRVESDEYRLLGLLNR